MSLPPELRVLCFQLSSTPVADLPRLTPTLLRYVLHCHGPLSTPLAAAGKADAPASSVLIRKLKTQLTTLLNGKSSEGRFTAVVLIKAVVEVGGWEILNGSEPWVRGLLSVLVKSDSVVLKELCIIALTKIYFLTLPYQTLVREITTPTLPTYVTSCLNLIAAKPSSKAGISTSLEDAVFRSFVVLLPRHPNTFRPFVTQIRAALRPFLAPTSSDGLFVSSSLKDSARQLMVLSHQTVAKNGGGEEWAKSVRELIQDIHVTADNVFRAVVEDWESSTGYISISVDVNQELQGGAKSKDDLPAWKGIFAGVERLTGLLELLAEYMSNRTSTPVTLPLGVIMDMVNRMLSIAMPSESSKGPGSLRLHPAIDREEREALWCGMPEVYVAALRLLSSTADSLEEGFVTIARGSLDQIVWVFPSGKHSSDFRTMAYQVISKILVCIGGSLNKSQAAKIAGIARSCCQDLSYGPNFEKVDTLNDSAKPQKLTNQNADTFLPSKIREALDSGIETTDVSDAAWKLLPLLLSRVPQQYLDISLRSLIERTAILASHKDAMLASTLHPFIGKNGKALPTILPHLTREFPDEDTTEILLRPRMPLLPSTSTRLLPNDAEVEESEDEAMEYDNDLPTIQEEANGEPALRQKEAPGTPHKLNPHGDLNPAKDGLVHDTVDSVPQQAENQPRFATSPAPFSTSANDFLARNGLKSAAVPAEPLKTQSKDVPMSQEDDSSDDESVHLNMELDSDSDSEMDESAAA